MSDTDAAPVVEIAPEPLSIRKAISVPKSQLDPKLDSSFKSKKAVLEESLKRFATAAKGQVPPAAQKTAQTALKKFRPGKIPVRVFEQVLGLQRVYYEVLEEMFRADLAVNHPETEMLTFDKVELQDDKDFYTVAATVYPLPVLRLSPDLDFQQFELEASQPSTPEEIDTRVQEKFEVGLRSSLKPTEKDTIIGIEQGAICTITGYRDGVVFAPACVKDLMLFTGGIPSPSIYASNADYLLLGLKAGDTAVREVEWWDGEKVQLEVKILKGLWLRTLEPEEAAKLRDFESCEAWKVALHDEIVKEEVDRRKRSLRTQLAGKLRNGSSIGRIPDKWLESQSIARYQEALSKAPDEKTLLMQASVGSVDELMAKYQSDAAMSMDEYLLIRSFGQAVGMTFEPGIKPEDLIDKVIDWLDQHGKIKRLTAAEAKARAEAAKAKELEAKGQEVPVVEPQALLEQQQESAPG